MPPPAVGFGASRTLSMNHEYGFDVSPTGLMYVMIWGPLDVGSGVLRTTSQSSSIPWTPCFRANPESRVCVDAACGTADARMTRVRTERTRRIREAPLGRTFIWKGGGR